MIKLRKKVSWLFITALITVVSISFSLVIDKTKSMGHETIESVASAKELKAYFERAKKMQRTEAMVTQSSELSNEESSASAKSDGDHSTTNNQVEGVDEADNVKTDGNYIYTVMGNNKVTITDIRDPKKIRKASEIKMEEEFYPSAVVSTRRHTNCSW